MKTIFKEQNDYFLTNATLSYDFRIKQLSKLYDALTKYEPDLIEALNSDLGKSEYEAYSTEVGFVKKSISHTKKKLKKWMKTKKVKTPLYMMGAKSYVTHDPLGTVLIIGPYNYPLHLVIEPLIGAIAAGNTIILKPSEQSPKTETIVKEMLNSTFDQEYIHVFTGEKEVTETLTSLPFDHIFFTGSTQVGKLIYQAAAKNLIPVTLELGGKSPVIVDETANLKVAAKRIVFGKTINAGQTCIAPDYIYVHETVQEAFIDQLKTTLNTFYPEYKTDYGVIINDRHFNRLNKLINDKLVVNDYLTDKKTRLMTPIIMDNVSEKDPVMQEEIFGPILPIIPYNSEDDLINTLKNKAKPLALYLFSANKSFQKRVFKELSFGGGAINDTIQHIINPNLGFGGVGASGIGNYHGMKSFTCFSHEKSYTKKTTKFDPNLLYPPYKNRVSLIKKILK